MLVAVAASVPGCRCDAPDSSRATMPQLASRGKEGMACGHESPHDAKVLQSIAVGVRRGNLGGVVLPLTPSQTWGLRTQDTGKPLTPLFK